MLSDRLSSVRVHGPTTKDRKILAFLACRSLVLEGRRKSCPMRILVSILNHLLLDAVGVASDPELLQILVGLGRR